MKSFFSCIICFLLLQTVLQTPIVSDAFASKTIEVDGVGVSQESAVKSGLKIAVGQIAGLYLMSESQVENGILTKDVIVQKTSGFIQSYKIKSCIKNNDLYHCKIYVSVENDQKKIVRFLKKMIGNKTCSVDIAEFILENENKDRIVQPMVIGLLIENGYYVVSNSFEPSYSINGKIKIEHAQSQLETPTFKLARLNTVNITSNDKTTILEVINNSSINNSGINNSGINNCLKSGQNINEAGIEVLKCLAENMAGSINKLIKSMKGK